MSTKDTARDLLAYVDASPTPFHAVAETIRRLQAVGFTELREEDAWTLSAGDAHYVARHGTIIAFRIGRAPVIEAGFRVIGAHTDSPNLRVKPRPDVTSSGYRQLGVQTYGGLLDYTWLDRDLGLAGRVMVSGGDGKPPVARLFRIDRPIARIPSLAIHLNREIRTDGLKLNAQKHLPLVLGLEDKDAVQTLVGLLATTLDIGADQILSWDISAFDIIPSTLGGVDEAFIHAPRLDNQAMCHAALAAMVASSAHADTTSIIALHDHEEVGSNSATGAGGPMVEQLMQRIVEGTSTAPAGGALARAISQSMQVSADMAHAIHPNYSDRHDPEHMPRINAGPVVKLNAQQRYATDDVTTAKFRQLCRDANVPCQDFVTRTDLACGSTIGPITSTRLGIPTVDVGNPMLSMHSIRETAGSEDPAMMVAVMTALLDGK